MPNTLILEQSYRGYQYNLRSSWNGPHDWKFFHRWSEWHFQFRTDASTHEVASSALFYRRSHNVWARLDTVLAALRYVTLCGKLGSDAVLNIKSRHRDGDVEKST